MSREQQARSNYKELCEALNRKNWLRAFVSSIIMAVLIPAFLILVTVTGMYGTHTSGIRNFLIVIELFEILMCVLGFLLISGEETDKLKLYYRIYFYISSFLLLFLARADLAYSGSIFIYMLLGIGSFSVPVFINHERRIYAISFSLLMVITGASAAGVSRATLEIVLFAILSIFISRYVSDNTVSHESLQVKLRAKTITSEKDPLTGLSNRRGLERKASVLWPYCTKNRINLGVIEIDIDYFKKYNDKFGHPAGDKCLKLVASAIKKAASSSTEIVARTGGEEFIVFAQGLDKEDMIDLAMNIRKSIDELQIKHACVNVSANLTVSMGMAIAFPGTMVSFDELYEEADKALYKAKSNGRNCIVYDDKMYGRMKNGLASLII